MTALDTNVLVRHFMQDDPTQIEPAKQFMNSLSAEEPGWICLPVVVELVWVLLRTYRLNKQALVYVLDTMLGSQELVLEQADSVRRSVHIYRNTKADFQDCLIAATAQAAGCSRTVTFDEIAARDAGMELLK
jgi:predicted nucleic-acid-binding protein